MVTMLRTVIVVLVNVWSKLLKKKKKNGPEVVEGFGSWGQPPREWETSAKFVNEARRR